MIKYLPINIYLLTSPNTLYKNGIVKAIEAFLGTKVCSCLLKQMVGLVCKIMAYLKNWRLEDIV